MVVASGCGLQPHLQRHLVECLQSCLAALFSICITCDGLAYLWVTVGQSSFLAQFVPLLRQCLKLLLRLWCLWHGSNSTGC
jgi:hypothetical protein